MRIEFAEQRLALIRTDHAHKLGLPISVIKSCRDKLHAIENASTELTLRNLKSLNYKKLEGSEFATDKDQRSIPNEVQVGQQHFASDRYRNFHWRPALRQTEETNVEF